MTSLESCESNLPWMLVLPDLLFVMATFYDLPARYMWRTLPMWKAMQEEREIVKGARYIQPQLRKAGREDSMNLKALSDDNYENQENGRVFADSAHINGTTARNVISTGVSPGRTEEGRLGSNATLISGCPSGWGCSGLFSRVFCSTLKA